jgi:hypothetical protein
MPGPVITVRMGFPTLLGARAGERAGVSLEIADEVSRQQIVHLRLTDQQFRDLFAGSQVTPEIEFVNPHPERWGHEQTIWIEGFATEEEANAFRIALDSMGWSVNAKPYKTNSVAQRFQVTGRRWDGEKAGTYCRAHRRAVLPEHVCYGCVVGDTAGAPK